MNPDSQTGSGLAISVIGAGIVAEPNHLPRISSRGLYLINIYQEYSIHEFE